MDLIYRIIFYKLFFYFLSNLHLHFSFIQTYNQPATCFSSFVFNLVSLIYSSRIILDKKIIIIFFGNLIIFINILFISNIEIILILGPDFWGRLNPKWSHCNKGRRQSPVDINPELLLFDPGLLPVHIHGDHVSQCLLKIL